MTEKEIIEAKRAYFKEWRAKNKDKVKAMNKRYWAKRAERIAIERKGEQQNEQHT